MNDDRRQIGYLRSKELVVDRAARQDRAVKAPADLHEDNAQVWEHLAEALAKVDSDGRESIIHETSFDRIVGFTQFATTYADDKRQIVWVPNLLDKLGDSRGHTRVVNDRFDREPTRLMTLQLKQLDLQAYELLDFWYGPWIPPEPYEPGAGPEALAFWLTHAVLVLTIDEAARRTMSDSMPPEWEARVKLYGDTDVVKAALQRKEESDSDKERLRLAMDVFSRYLRVPGKAKLRS